MSLDICCDKFSPQVKLYGNEWIVGEHGETLSPDTICENLGVYWDRRDAELIDEECRRRSAHERRPMTPERYVRMFGRTWCADKAAECRSWKGKNPRFYVM